MKKALLASAIAAVLGVPAVAAAQGAAPAATSPHTVTGNFSIVSDYRFRGISQTDKKPALQGGIDYSHSSGFYLGNWNSSVSGEVYNSAAGIEMDFYGGYKPVIGDVTLDIGALYYYYPGAHYGGTDEKYNTLEAYLGASYGPVSFKVWYALTDWFAVNSETYGGACDRDGGDCFGADPGDSKGSVYYEVNGTFPLAEGFNLVGHIGYQDVRHYSKLDYFDYKVGVTYDYKGWLLGAALVGTDADEDWYYMPAPDSTRTGTTGVVVSVSKTF